MSIEKVQLQILGQLYTIRARQLASNYKTNPVIIASPLKSTGNALEPLPIDAFKALLEESTVDPFKTRVSQGSESLFLFRPLIERFLSAIPKYAENHHPRLATKLLGRIRPKLRLPDRESFIHLMDALIPMPPLFTGGQFNELPSSRQFRISMQPLLLPSKLIHWLCISS
jgi:hypothetical protein